MFSPNERLFDVWDYRACFFDGNGQELNFIAGFSKGNPEGIIPLVLSKKTNQYNYFGGWFTAERNSLYIKDKSKITQFLEQCPENTCMEGLDPAEGRSYNFPEDEFTHYLDLSKFNYSFDEYFSSLDKKKQKNLRYDLKSIPEHKVHYNKTGDFKRLAELNIRRFEEDSKFNDPAVMNGVSRLIKLAGKKGILDMISVEIAGKVQAVDVCATFKGRYYALIGSSNYQKVPNIGKLMTVLDIKSAMAKKARFIEFGATADHWKKMWNFDKEMLLKFVK